MEIGRLQAFVHVDNLLSFSKAAEALYLTQPTVTARIQGLERELGEPLFERMGRTIRLTDAGHSFLPHAQRALQAIKEGSDAIATLRDVERGTLSIGTAPTIGTYVLPELLQRFNEQFPGVEVSIQQPIGKHRHCTGKDHGQHDEHELPRESPPQNRDSSHFFRVVRRRSHKGRQQRKGQGEHAVGNLDGRRDEPEGGRGAGGRGIHTPVV